MAARGEAMMRGTSGAFLLKVGLGLVLGLALFLLNSSHSYGVSAGCSNCQDPSQGSGGLDRGPFCRGGGDPGPWPHETDTGLGPGGPKGIESKIEPLSMDDIQGAWSIRGCDETIVMKSNSSTGLGVASPALRQGGDSELRIIVYDRDCHIAAQGRGKQNDNVIVASMSDQLQNMDFMVRLSVFRVSKLAVDQAEADRKNSPAEPNSSPDRRFVLSTWIAKKEGSVRDPRPDQRPSVRNYEITKRAGALNSFCY